MLAVKDNEDSYTAILLLRITCIFWIIAKLMSWKLWVATRVFPLVPLFDITEKLPDCIHLLLLIISLTLLAVLIIKPQNNKYLLFIIITVEFFSCLLDQNRWQPWEYQYLFTFFIIAVNRRKIDVVKYAFIFLLVSMYIYSGLHKLNTGFLRNIWSAMILSAYMKASPQFIHNTIVFHSGYLLGIIECAAGIGLLFSRTKRSSAKLLIIMHLFNLLFLGPLGLHYNKIIWPWNIVMIIYLYILFIPEQATHVSFSHFRQLSKGYNWLVLLCWGVLPALSFGGYWDQYLSSNLYSGDLYYMAICVNDTTALKQARPYFSKKDTQHLCDGANILFIQNWAMAEMGAPPYPEIRVYKKIKEVCIQKYSGEQCHYILYHFLHNGMVQKAPL